MKGHVMGNAGSDWLAGFYLCDFGDYYDYTLLIKEHIVKLAVMKLHYQIMRECMSTIFFFNTALHIDLHL